MAERRAFEQEAFGNLAYYAGQQHFIAENGTIRLPRRLNPRKTHYKANLILPAVEKAIARLVSANIEQRVAPQSSALADREASRTANKVLDHLKRQTRYRAKQEQSLRWAAIIGSGFRKIIWNPFAGKPLRTHYDEEGNALPLDTDPLTLREAERAKRYKDAFVGDVDVEVPGFFQIGWDWKAREGGVADANFMWQTHAADLDDMRNLWGNDALEGVQPMETDSGAQQYEDAVSTLTTTMGLNLGQSHTRITGNRVRTIEWFERPLRKNDWQGRHIVIAGNRVLKDSTNPYVEVGTPLPFVKDDWFQMPGRFIGLSLVSQLRTIQKAYNESRSVAYDIEQTHGYPVTVLDRRAGIQKTKLFSLPGPVFEGDFRHSPKPIDFIPQPTLPPYVAENADRARGELNAIAASASPTKEQYPAGIRSSLAIQAIQEETNAPLSPIARRLAENEAEAGSQMLRLVHSNYEYARLVHSVGKGSEFEPVWFLGADLRGHTEVKVFGESVRVESSTAGQERLAMLIELGVVNPADPVQRVQILKAMDAKTADEIVNDNLQDERQEEKALRSMLAGQPVPVLGPEDPHVRAKVLERFIKSDDFFRQHPDIQRMLMERWQAWSQKIQAQLQAELQMQAALAGSQSNPKGTPSAPKRAANA